ncbi:MAG: gluconate 2-dehydrogenase subunit 3 family protein [Candidatus Sulfotelmatobacter sp.]
MSISRRDLIKSLSLTAAAGSMLRVVPLTAAETARRLVGAHKVVSSSSGEYAPKFFPEHQYKTLRALCQAIIPSDQESGGAIEAGAPEFLDLLSSENKDLQLQLGGGIMWLDATCMERYGQTYLQCAPAQRTEMLDLIAFRKNADKDPRLSPGIEFFSTLRRYTADGFFTSEIGIQYLGYIGNTYLKEFPGCPAIPEA